MGKKRSKSFDPFKEAVDVGTVGIGVVGVTGVTGKIAKQYPGGTSDNVMKGMSTMSILPTIRATGSVFSSLQYLEKKSKRRK